MGTLGPAGFPHPTRWPAEAQAAGMRAESNLMSRLMLVALERLGAKLFRAGIFPLRGNRQLKQRP